MKNLNLFAIIVFTISLNSSAYNINKPISSQFGFIENKGQIIDQNNNPNPSVLYLYNGNGLRVQLRKEGFSYEVINTVKTPKTIIDKVPQDKFYSGVDSFDITYQTHRVDINFKEGNKNAILKPYQPASDFINYYTTGTSEAGVTNVHHFQKVVYENVYPNIDIEFVLNDATNRGKFKYNFIVKPNGNLADIKLAFLGARHTSLNQAGNILIETAHGNIEENIPLSYVINIYNSHSTIKANFITLENNIYGIVAENYNHNQTLVIDPTNWATYFGGSFGDRGYGITTDTSGSIIITGYVGSTNAIATTGAYQTTCGGANDAFIAKFNTNGVKQWATYYGGSGNEHGSGIATDKIGNIIITGQTGSTNAIATAGAFQTTYGGSFDAFIVKFNANGVRQWATYYGGSDVDRGHGITTDKSGNIIITGETGSTNAIATTGAYQPTRRGNDAFIAKFDANGLRQWATYFGGSSQEKGYGITTDTSGNIIITGETYSTDSIATTGSYQTIYGGGASDAFIVKFNSNGIMQWATYYGGSDGDFGNGITTDMSGNIIITGGTYSTDSIATTSSHQTINGGGNGQDAFIAKFNTNGVRQWATYYGGIYGDYGYGVITDMSGNIIIIGETLSPNAIATTGAYQTTIGGGSGDAFIAKFNAIGTRQWASYYGGSDWDGGRGIATDMSGNIIITGYTSSTNAIATLGSHQTTNGGNGDVFIAKFNTNGVLPVKLISFNANKKNDDVLLNWETSSEINSGHFELERSEDGQTFKTIHNHKAAGNSNTNLKYNYFDNKPFNLTNALKLFYRLKNIDLDGTFTYSMVKLVENSSEEDILNIYPNPSSGIFTISSSQAKDNITVLDFTGKLVYNQQNNGKQTNIELDLSALSNGIYFIHTQTENGQTSSNKIVITK